MINIAEQIPNFEGFDLQEALVRSDDLEGYPTILLFFKNLTDVAELSSLYNDYLADFGIFETQVVGISTADKESLQNLATTSHLHFPLILDPEGKIFSLFRVETDTAAFIVDWDKTIRWIEAPIIMERHIDRLMDALEENCG